MIDVINTFRNGDVDRILMANIDDKNLGMFLNDVKKETDGVDILLRILPKLITKVDNKILFDVIYDIKELTTYTYYLLHRNLIHLKDLGINQLVGLLNNTTWGEEFILHNLEAILEEHAENKISTLARIIVNNEDRYYRFLNKFIYKIDPHKRALFIVVIIGNNIAKINLDTINMEKIILEDPSNYDYEQISMFNDQMSPKLLPYDDLMTLLLNCVNHKVITDKTCCLSDAILKVYNKNDVCEVLMKSDKPYIKEYIMTNFDKLFKSSIKAKMKMLFEFRYKLNKEMKEQYDILIEMFKTIDLNKESCYKIFNGIIDYDVVDYVKNLVNKYLEKSVNKKLSYIGRGATSCVFKVGDYVIKLGNERFCRSCPEHFRIIKNVEKKIIIDDNDKPVYYIEIQEYLNNDKTTINEDAIYLLFKDLDNDGLEITDPNSLDYDPRNFAILKDYKDANSLACEQLPSYFKECPLVIIDIDLIYRKDEVNKRYFSPRYSFGEYRMERSIKWYEEKKLIKSINKR